ncbi:ArdC family protein [Sulfurovum sp. CS9]|uniref:ArdC family protein n=1 Tax=Sulfurovum sp. CS9 TaxID=3391146 RepID=UPI0039E8FFC1
MENNTNTPHKKITARDKYNTIVGDFIHKLENNDTEPWTKSWSMSSSLPKNFETENAYSGMNILTLMGQGFKDSRWLTFNQIKKLGGSVKKGSKSTPIFFMKPVDQTKLNKTTGEEENNRYFLMQAYNVFNMEQTENIKYEPEVKPSDKNNPISDYIETIGIDEFMGAPAYSAEHDVVFMPQAGEFESENEYYSTYFHELTHATGHRSRLDRFEKHTVFGDESYAFEELIAELGSAFLSMEHGIAPNSKKQADYLKSWITALKEKPQVLYSAASHATKGVNCLNDIVAAKRAIQMPDIEFKPIDITTVKQPIPSNNRPSKTPVPKVS